MLTLTLPHFLSPSSLGGAEGEGPRNFVRVIEQSSGETVWPESEILVPLRGTEADARVACEKLYLQYAPKLIPYAHGYVHSRALAEEIVHEVFLAIWIRRAQFAPTHGIGAYLYAAVRNRALKVRRHSVVQARYDREIQRESTVTLPDFMGETEALAAVIERVFKTLPEPSREALTLRRNHDLSYREIGHILGISEDAVRVRIARAEQALRKAIEPLMRG